MDFAALRSFFELPSTVVWFALLVAVFAVFVGVGLYVTRREARHKAAAAETVPAKALTSRFRTPAAPSHAARRGGNHSRSRRELNHPQETS